MDSDTAAKVNRLFKLERRAEAHYQRLMKAGSFHQRRRAAWLVMAVAARWSGGEVSTYRG